MPPSIYSREWWWAAKMAKATWPTLISPNSRALKRRALYCSGTFTRQLSKLDPSSLCRLLSDWHRPDDQAHIGLFWQILILFGNLFSFYEIMVGIIFFNATELIRHQGSQKKYKRTTKVTKAKSKILHSVFFFQFFPTFFFLELIEWRILLAYIRRPKMLL